MRFSLNGRQVSVDAEPGESLLDVLRERCGLRSMKDGCAPEGSCGACTVIVDGRIVDACLVLAVEADGAEVTTIEGLAVDGHLDPLQAAFLDTGAVQCGFCTPGQLIAAHALLAENPHPTVAEIQEGLAGNLCRCGCYGQITEAVRAVAGEDAP